MSNNWVPEVMYEDNGEEGLTSHIPFIPVPKDEEMPKLLYVFESRETGEFEPGPEGEELSVTEMELHQYADMNVLKSNLDLATYDKVREVLGLQSMSEAVTKGKDITNNIRKSLGQEYLGPDGKILKDIVLNTKKIDLPSLK
jgi:hypothetical protein